MNHFSAEIGIAAIHYDQEEKEYHPKKEMVQNSSLNSFFYEFIELLISVQVQKHNLKLPVYVENIQNLG